MSQQKTRSASRMRAVIALLAFLLAVSACGSDSSESGSSSDSASDSPSEAASESADEGSGAEEAASVDADEATERMIEHRLGTTAVPANPERVVTMGYTDQDYVLALGVVPVGIRDWFGDQPSAVWPWAQDLLGGEEPTIIEREPNFEAIAALQPDLIIAIYAGLTEEHYDLLSQIAPTVTQPPDSPDFEITWEEQTLHTGLILGREDEAQALVDNLSAKLEAAKNDHPEFDGVEYAFASAYDSEYYLYGATSTASRFLVGLGFKVPEETIELTDNDNDYFIFSAERMDLVDRPVTVWSEGTSDAGIGDLLELSVYSDLAVHQEGRDLFLGLDLYGGAFSFSTVLSLELLVDDLVPALSAAVDGDPTTVPAIGQ